MKLWDKGTDLNSFIENFTIGKDKELDLLLAEYDVLGTIAHIKMLESINLLNKEDIDILIKELINIHDIIKHDWFFIENGVEDVHSQIELMLTRKLGDIGKKVHSGRSRNDQVLLDLKLFIRNEIKLVVKLTNDLFTSLVTLSEKYKHVLMPGYTHLQIAMPSSFGLWFGAYAEGLTDDMVLLQAAYRITNQNPLGSAAGFGSSFPLNRQLTSDLLGFDNLNYNVVYAQMGRGKVERIVSYAIASIGATLAKLAMDVGLYITQNFNFISFPDEFTTGSSIMPHKKNPDAFEIIRARGNKMQALPNEITILTTNLPSGYHRDMQLTKEAFLPAFGDLKFCLHIAKLLLDNIIIKNNICDNDMYKYMFSVEEVNKQVLSGVPFRDAYKNIGKSIEDGTFNPDRTINHTHEGSIGNLCNDRIIDKMNNILKGFNFDKVESALSKLIDTQQLNR